MQLPFFLSMSLICIVNINVANSNSYGIALGGSLSLMISQIIGNVRIFSDPTPLDTFGTQTKTSQITLLLHLSLLYFNLMAPLPSQLFLKQNSSLKPLLKTLPWMIQGLFLPPLPLLTTSCCLLKSFVKMYSMPLLA